MIKIPRYLPYWVSGWFFVLGYFGGGALICWILIVLKTAPGDAITISTILAVPLFFVMLGIAAHLDTLWDKFYWWYSNR